MIATVGARVKVRVFSTERDRKAQQDWAEVEAVVTSAGPRGITAAWARTTGQPAEWLLIRKPLSSIRRGVPGQFDAVRGDLGPPQ